MAKTAAFNRRNARPSKVAQSKVYEYIKKVEIDGLPRVRAYAEAIDPTIYDNNVYKISHILDSFQSNCPDYTVLKEMVLAENKDWALRKSTAIQNKAVDLLSNLLDKANDIAKDPNADAKDLNVAVSTLKSIMPAFTAIGNTANGNATATTDRKTRAGKYIN